jgi:HPt (histidine-containing phosphotransfer) domain-containing protein
MKTRGTALVALADTALSAALVTALDPLGWDATVTADVAEALALLRARRPGLLLLDVDATDGLWPSLTAELQDHAAQRPLVLGLAADDAPQARLTWARRGIDRLVQRALDSAALDLATRTDLPAGYDPALVERLRLLDPDLATGALHDFLADVPRRLAALRAAFEQGNESVLRLHAHSLKGSGSQVGTLRLALLGAGIEDLVARGAPREQVAPRVAALEAEFERLRPCLQAEAGSNQAS